MVIRHTPDNNFREVEYTIKQASSASEDLMQAKHSSSVSSTTMSNSEACSGTYLARESSQDDSVGALSLVSLDQNGIDAYAAPKKRVSFGRTVEVRSYDVIQGDHPSCTLPLTLDWEPTSTSQHDFAESLIRQSQYKMPQRLSLEERRLRLYGSVQDTMADFAQTDSSLDELMKGLDELLSAVTVPGSPLNKDSNNNSSSSTLPLPVFEPSVCWDDYSTSLPLALASSYEEFLTMEKQPKRLDAPTVHWRRVAC